jgi:hypothetical protein
VGKKQRILLAGLLVVALGGFAWLVLSQPLEPVYEGKPLGLWLEGYNPIYYTGRTTLSPDGQAAQSDEAVRSIGTNGIPVLLRELRKRDSPLKLKLMALAGWQRFLKYRSDFAVNRNAAAARAFDVLGSAASNAVPALIEMYDQPGANQNWIASVFSSIGPAARRQFPRYSGPWPARTGLFEAVPLLPSALFMQSRALSCPR